MNKKLLAKMNSKNTVQLRLFLKNFLTLIFLIIKFQIVAAAGQNK